MADENLLTIDLTDEERNVLYRGLLEWGGPASCTDALAAAMDFGDVAGLHEQKDRLADSIRAGQPLTRRDWRRALVATEIVFASDVYGSGLDWPITTGLADDETITLLRSLQRKLL